MRTKFSPLTFLVALSILGLADVVRAEVRLARIFADHMVLQRDASVPIWGFAEKGEKVTVSFAGQTQRATADAAGRWSVSLDPLSANAKGQTLVARGSNETVIRDALVGEVWYVSGQSNMGFSVRAMAKSLNAGKKLIETADDPLLRYRKVNEKESATLQADLPDRLPWAICNS
ncbi:MAG: sialate O-acetylesterase, partial [Planctomycetales bacterium]